MNQQISNKLAKIHELINRAGSDGEKAAAQNALDRIVAKHNITAEQLNNLDKNNYTFTYTSVLELWLFSRLNLVFLGDRNNDRICKRLYDHNLGKAIKQLVAYYTYEEYITIECSYEYFRRHMGKEWRRVSKLQIASKKKPKTKNKSRKQLQDVFANAYFIKSKLYVEEELKYQDSSKLSKAELLQHYQMRNVEGGQFNKQLINGNLLNQ